MLNLKLKLDDLISAQKPNKKNNKKLQIPKETDSGASGANTTPSSPQITSKELIAGNALEYLAHVMKFINHEDEAAELGQFIQKCNSTRGGGNYKWELIPQMKQCQEFVPRLKGCLYMPGGCAEQLIGRSCKSHEIVFNNVIVNLGMVNCIKQECSQLDRGTGYSSSIKNTLKFKRHINPASGNHCFSKNGQDLQHQPNGYFTQSLCNKISKIKYIVEREKPDDKTNRKMAQTKFTDELLKKQHAWYMGELNKYATKEEVMALAKEDPLCKAEEQ